MNNTGKNALKLLAVALALASSTNALAQSAKQWAVSLGVERVVPIVSYYGRLSAPVPTDAQVDLEGSTKPVLIVTYMLTDNVSLEANLAAPLKFDMTGAGSYQGTGKLGSLEYTPYTLLAQYRFFEAKAAFRPYLSAGLTYGSVEKTRGSGQLTALTNPGSSTPTTFKGDSQFGVTVGLGATFAFNERWFADAALSKTFLKSKVQFSTGQSVNLKLDPVVTRVAIGYRF